jgi:flagellar biosynthetic protein FliP
LLVAVLLVPAPESAAGGIIPGGSGETARITEDRVPKASGSFSEPTKSDHAPEAETHEAVTPSFPPSIRPDVARSLQTVALIALFSLAPVALLMLTAFVRINIVLILLRQALGSSQVPSNQILTALALMLTALVMYPKGEDIYRFAVLPYASGKVTAREACETGSRLIKTFMIEQIEVTKHEQYVQAFLNYAAPSSSGHAEQVSAGSEELPLRVVAPAYLLSELTTALKMGFYLYMPFLVIDLVVSSVLAATGLFMLPPALVATPLKLIVFVLADGWVLVAMMLLSSFTVSDSSP